jgi:hypothetical protein
MKLSFGKFLKVYNLTKKLLFQSELQFKFKAIQRTSESQTSPVFRSWESVLISNGPDIEWLW